MLRPAALLVLLALTACAPRADRAPAGPPDGPPRLTRQATGADSVLFIGVAPVDAATVWLAGTRGTFARTTDGGVTWNIGTVPGADTLQFRDVHAFSEDAAVLLSIGSGDASRIYRTDDGGATWTRAWTNPDPDAFYDCFGFWEDGAGLAFSDGVDGVFPVVRTTDAGRTWSPLPRASLPAATPGEGSFAASGTCLVTHGDSLAWFSTGAGATARVVRTEDRGRSWTAAATPVVSGAAAGIAALAFRDAEHGLALGGDVAQRQVHDDNVARTADGGRTWTLAGPPPDPGAVDGAAYAADGSLVAAGPGGVALTRDDARTWTALDSLAHWSVGFAGTTGWAVGPEGRVTRIDLGAE